MQSFSRVAAAVVAFVVLSSQASLPAGRVIAVRNHGTQPIFRLYIGHVQSRQWSADLLPFNDILDVGEETTVTVDTQDACLYDVRAEYRDKTTSDLAQVDLCAAQMISFDR